MSWLVLILLAVFIDAFIVFGDNYISDVYFKGRQSNAQKLLHGFCFVVSAIVIAIIAQVDLTKIPILAILLLIVSGMISSFASIFYYRALEIEDSTNLSIFLQLAPLLYLVYECLVMGRDFTITQLIAFIIILLAPAIIVLCSRKNSRKTKLRAVAFAAIYVTVSVAGHIMFVRTNTDYNLSFVDAMTLLTFGKGVANLLIVYVLNRKLAKRFFTVKKQSHGKLIFPLAINSIACVVKDFIYRYGLLLAPAMAFASAASDSVEPIVIFIVGIILTLINPKFGREKLNKKSVLVHLVATILVVVGIILLQF